MLSLPEIYVCMQGQNVFLVLFLLLIQVMAAVWYVAWGLFSMRHGRAVYSV